MPLLFIEIELELGSGCWWDCTVTSHRMFNSWWRHSRCDDHMVTLTHCVPTELILVMKLPMRSVKRLSWILGEAAGGAGGAFSMGFGGLDFFGPLCQSQVPELACISVTLSTWTLRTVHNNTTTQHAHNNNNTIWGGSVLTGEERPPHTGELKHALLQAGGPTQSQLSRPMSSGHHISMEHRQRRKRL